MTALDKAVVAAEEALKAPESLTYQQIVDLKAGIEGALSSPVLKYAGTELQQLVDSAVADGSKFTPESWKAYQDALDAAKAGLENADNLSQAEGDRLARELKDALAALVENADQGESGSGNGGSGNGGAGNGGQGGNSNCNGANGSTGKPGSSSDKLVQTGRRLADAHRRHRGRRGRPRRNRHRAQAPPQQRLSPRVSARRAHAIRAAPLLEVRPFSCAAPTVRDGCRAARAGWPSRRSSAEPMGVLQVRWRGRGVAGYDAYLETTGGTMHIALDKL